ncbi:MAG TPA: hypothetical protein VK083_10455 [Nocardia sp.]|uniref:hypothetical protein n=1 Tax=Nocardia TaxID=1817 RepID=UPI002456D3DA|nr:MULTISPECIES: hypothetical protein [Nocardia]HLS77199.1 hypothetical protein [Nocardia sp.]
MSTSGTGSGNHRAQGGTQVLPARPGGRRSAAEGPAGRESAGKENAFHRCRRYRTDHRLFAEVDPALGRIMLEVGAVGAVVMPATLGASVAAALSGPHRCPIIAHPRSDRWTFLTGPTDNSYLDMSLFADLFRVCASIALPGSRIVLPSPADERTGYRSWVSAPEDDYRPDLTEVTTVTRAAAAAPRCGMN